MGPSIECSVTGCREAYGTRYEPLPGHDGALVLCEAHEGRKEILDVEVWPARVFVGGARGGKTFSYPFEPGCPYPAIRGKGGYVRPLHEFLVTDSGARAK